MGYYDDTVAYYDKEITNAHTSIGQMNNKIKALDDDIAELRALLLKVGDVEKAVNTAANKTEEKILGLPAVITNPFSILKTTGSFFSRVFDVIRGSERVSAHKGIEEAVKKINKKINELKNEIDDLKHQITQCNQRITTLNTQKNSYIKKATEPKPQPAAKQEPKKEEPKNTETKKSSSKSSKSSKKSSSKKSKKK